MLHSKMNFFVEESIVTHPAWHGEISELDSERYLEKSGPFQYLLRAGEGDSHFYVSYVDQELDIKHQSFKIRYTEEGWFCVQGILYGPFQAEGIEPLIHQLMHCREEECASLKNQICRFVKSA